MNVHVDCSEARRRMQARAHAVRDVARVPLLEAADRAAEKAEATTAWKDKSGRTRRSIRPMPGPGPNASSVVAKGAAPFLEAGTGRYGLRGQDYVIVPRNAKMLRFRVAGRWVFAKRVVHPGIHATHFMRDAGEATRPFFVMACQRELAKVLRGR